MRSWQMAFMSAALVVAGFFVTSGTASAYTDPRDLPNLASCPTMRVGSRGLCVEALQYSLKVAGLNVPQTGNYAGMTRGAVMAFQAQEGLAKDGVAGPQTIRALDRVANSVEPSRSFRDCPQLSVGVTHGCVDRFWYEFTGIPGNPDAYRANSTTYTREMANAVRDYQRRNSLVVDGVAGRQTADLIDVQAGPQRVCLAMGGDSYANGVCQGAGAVGMGKSVWDCVGELAGKDIVEAIERSDDSARKAGEVIPKGAFREFLKKFGAPYEAFKCVSFG